MKIGIVCYPTYGGSGVLATELGMELARKGHEIHFITYSQPVRLQFSENVYYHEVQISNYPLFEYTPYELVLTSTMVDVIKTQGLDLLHVHYAIPHASAALMARSILEKEGIRIPIITTLHGTDITLVGKDDSFRPVITYAINESDAVTAVSQSLIEDTRFHFGIDRKIEMIPNFVCLDKYKVQVNEGLKKRYAPNGERIVTHISNFRAVKRVPDVVEAFSRMCQDLPARLLLAGDGPERHKVEQLVAEKGMKERVSFLGKVRGTEEVLAISDLFLLTSETESFGLAALEAMASGVPVVSTNQGGLPEVNIDGVSGYLCEVGDVEALGQRSCDILRDPETLAQFKARAKEQAARFQVGKVLPQYEKLYNELVG